MRKLIAVLVAVVASTLYAAEKPNFIFILIDDMSPSAISCYARDHGEARIETPHMDALAEQGTRFTDAYVTPQCTPTRASFITGQYTARNRMWHVSPRYGIPTSYLKEPPYIENLPRDSYTIAKALKDNGYTTAIFGKWHLNQWTVLEDDPDGYYTRLFWQHAHHHGFDETDSSQILWGQTFNYPGDNDRIHEKGVEFLTDETIRFMTANRTRPFFVYLSHHSLHGKIMAPQELVDKYIAMGHPADHNALNNAVYYASIEHMDNNIGRLMEKVEELGLTEDTVIMLMTDNGGVDHQWDAAPLREGKGSPYEGGIRSPLVVRCPGTIPAGVVNPDPVHIVDIYPTLIDFAGGLMQRNWPLDGVSLHPALTSGQALKRDTLFWYQPLYDMGWGSTPSASVRRGDYKLVWHFGDYYNTPDNFWLKWDQLDRSAYSIGERVELFDLQNDIGEQHDLSRERPDLAEALLSDLKGWLADTQTQLPFKNPDYDPDNPFERGNHAAINMPPLVEAHEQIVRIRPGEPFSVSVDFYRSLDPGESLDISARLDGGRALPSWLSFDPSRRILTGTAPGPAAIDLEFSITDGKYPVTDRLTILVK